MIFPEQYQHLIVMHPLPTAFISPGGGELILIMLVLIMLFGAKDAPRILRTIQTFLDKTQRLAADFRYKIMYGDLHHPASEKPCDIKEDNSEKETSTSVDPSSEQEPKNENDQTPVP